MTSQTPLGVSLRPAVVRRDTEAILSYYQSDLADTGQAYTPAPEEPYSDADTPALSHTQSHRRTTSTSSSSSLYSTPATPPPVPDTTFPVNQDSYRSGGTSHRRRPSNISTNSEDTRRMAIVQSNTDRFLALEGRLGGPDGAVGVPANESKRTNHARGATVVAAAPASASAASSTTVHQRSMSDVPAPPPPHATFPIESQKPPARPPRPPRLRSPSPQVSRPISAEDAGLMSIAQALSPKTSLSSLRPGVDNTPLDRSLSPVNEASASSHTHSSPLHHAESSSHHVREGAFVPSRIMVTPPTTQDTIRLVGSPSDYLPLAAPERTTSANLPIDGLPLPGVLPLSRPDLQRDSSWISVQIPSDPPSEYSSSASELPLVAQSPMSLSPEPESQSTPVSTSNDIESILPEPPSGLRGRKEGAEPNRPSKPPQGLLPSDKRNSTLPRPPSIALSTTSTERTPSPSRPSPVRRKIISSWPDAMWCRDVMSQRTSLERAMGYAAKINELAQYDCGLNDWVISVHARRNKSDRSLTSSSQPAYMAMQVTQPRQVSNASIASEATFPIRADATVATDLTVRPSDIIPSAPPALPYPALAAATANAHPAPSNNRLSFAPSALATRSLPISAGRAQTGGGGFFASLGRNHSLKKEQQNGRPAQHARLIKPPPQQAPSRPIQVQSAPTVPGGPRAAPHRMSRSQTLMLPPPVSSSSNPSSPSSGGASPQQQQQVMLQQQQRRRSNTLKRPSLFGGSRSTGSGQTSSPSPSRSPAQSFAPEHDITLQADFQAQVDKLADIIPHADREMLAGYLRRAGQDILAIGQYLEDEKNGTIRRP